MEKKYFEWTEKYSVGVRILDMDYQELFQLVNDLHHEIERNEGQRHLVVIVGSLIKYVNEHFEREGHIMAEYKCPDLVEHQRHHHDFLRMVYAIRILLSVAPGQISPQKVLKLLTGWLHNHVLGDDQKYKRYILAGYGQRKTDLVEPMSHARKDTKSEPRDDDDTAMVSLHLNVPASEAQTLRRCAILLRQNKEQALAIRKLTDPLTSMTEQEGMKIARIVLA